MKNIKIIVKPDYALTLGKGRFAAGWDGEVWYADYRCPEDGYVEEDVPQYDEYAEIRFCPFDGCQMYLI